MCIEETDRTGCTNHYRHLVIMLSFAISILDFISCCILVPDTGKGYAVSSVLLGLSHNQVVAMGI